MFLRGSVLDGVVVVFLVLAAGCGDAEDAPTDAATVMSDASTRSDGGAADGAQGMQDSGVALDTDASKLGSDAAVGDAEIADGDAGPGDGLDAEMDGAMVAADGAVRFSCGPMQDCDSAESYCNVELSGPAGSEPEYSCTEFPGRCKRRDMSCEGCFAVGLRPGSQCEDVPGGGVRVTFAAP